MDESTQANNKTSGTLGSIEFNLTYLAEEKQLVIHLIRAKNLKAMDKNGRHLSCAVWHDMVDNV